MLYFFIKYILHVLHILHVLLFGDFNAHYDFENPVDASDFGITLYRRMDSNNLYSNN
jgi:hypothetical protein